MKITRYKRSADGSKTIYCHHYDEGTVQLRDFFISVMMQVKTQHCTTLITWERGYTYKYKVGYLFYHDDYYLYCRYFYQGNSTWNKKYKQLNMIPLNMISKKMFPLTDRDFLEHGGIMVYNAQWRSDFNGNTLCRDYPNRIFWK